MSKINTCAEAVKFAVGKARHAGELSIPPEYGVIRETGEGQKSGRWAVVTQLETGTTNRIMSGLWCGGRNADGTYDIEIREGLTYRV